MGDLETWLMAIGILVVLVLAIVAVWLLSRLEDIDSDTDTLTWTASAGTLTTTTSGIQFVTAGPAVIMTFATFTTTIVGANSFLTAKTIDSDLVPDAEVDFPVMVKNNDTNVVGLMRVLHDGSVIVYAGPNTTDLFGTMTPSIVYGTTVSWAQAV